MAGPSCVPHRLIEAFTAEVINKLSPEQLTKFGITNDAQKWGATKAIQALVARYVNAESDYVKQQQMLRDVDAFINDLENFFSVVKVSDAEFDATMEEYNKFKEAYLQEEDLSRLSTREYSAETQDEAATAIAILDSFDKVITYTVDYESDGKTVKSISFIVKEPQKSKGKNSQDKAWDTLQQIEGISHSQYPTESEITDDLGHTRFIKPYDKIPEGWRKTGRNKYRYNGKTILTESVSVNVNGYDPNPDFPVVAAPIGTHVDTVGRMAFDKSSELYNEDGTLVDNDTLEGIIADKLGNIFTVQGLKNLVQDFQQLEQQLQEKWGKDIRIFSGEISLFGKLTNDDLWINGKPDLLVVDGKGVVHVVDFKTSIMRDIKGYENVFHDNSYGSSKAQSYGKQVSRYIKILESYGLKVDEQPYIVLIDTWYDSSDHGSRNVDDNGDPIKDRKYIYKVAGKGQNISITTGEEEQSLAEYSAENPTSREEILSIQGKEVLYMEPRLHVSYSEKGGFSQELASLRGEGDLELDQDISFEQQWAALTEEEKENLQWLAGKPVFVKTAQGIVTLSERDIEGNPELMSSQEIQDLADLLMYKVSRTITALQRGESFKEIPLSQPGEGEDKSTVFLGKSRAYIIKTAGLDNLINLAFNTIERRHREDFPSVEEYTEGSYDDFDYSFEDAEDYQRQKTMNDKIWWIINPAYKHKEQLIMAGAAKLMALENSIIPITNKTQQPVEFNEKTPNTRRSVTDLFDIAQDAGDNASMESFTDMYLEGLSDVEAWMLNARNFSPKASLAQEIKRMYEDLEMKDAEGNAIMDPYGWGFSMPVDATQAIQTTLDACKNCETIEEQIAALRELAKNPNNLWINQILDKINSDKNLKAKFFRHFRKDALTYSICQVRFDKKLGQRVVETRIVNSKTALQAITDSLSASFHQGKVGSYYVNGVPFALVSRNASGQNVLTRLGNKATVAGQIHKDITKWMNKLKKLYQFNPSLYPGQTIPEVVGKLLQETDFDGKTIIQGITEVLNGVGILVTPDVVLNTCLKKVGKGPVTSNAGYLLRYAEQVLKELDNQEKNDGRIPDGLTGNKAYRVYSDILKMISDGVQEHVESSVYQDGKTYYSYANPNRLGHIVRNLKDVLGDSDKFKQYIKDNFGRYTGWYKTVDGERWLCDWVDQFENSAEARAALDHKVELAYIGNQYRNLGALGFQLSILHNYFGDKNDQNGNKQCRWFAMPTMSNKPTNEFIRMLKYKDNDTIVDKVLMNTFYQEMNRIADVLYHYTHHNAATDQIDLTDDKLEKAGWTQEEIDGLKSRIDSHTISAQDIVRLSSITSGAKFHFLWYLNDAIAQNAGLAERITSRINTLLTPDSAEKEANTDLSFEATTDKLVRETIVSNMEMIVENELQYMRDIGLFDTEVKKINGKDVVVLKYQEEFGGKLGSNEHGQGEQEMEERLREFIWQDIAANINIIQITGGDLAYYGNAVNYQKRIAQEHSPGLHLMHDDAIDDGYLRSVHISDHKVVSEVLYNAEVALDEYEQKNMSENSSSDREDFRKMASIVVSGFKRINSTDGQSFSCPSSIKKKLSLQGEWDEEREKAYQAISHGDFNINHLAVLMQPSKPFVTSDMAKYSGSPTMQIRRTPLQDKNSEYLILLAEALSRGAQKRSKMSAIFDFMEKTHKFGNGKQGIDTVHFASVGKVGLSGVIDIEGFDKTYEGKDEGYNEALTEFMLSKIRRKTTDPSVQENFDQEDRLVKEGILKKEEALYNNQYVDTIPVADYIIQQEVPADFLDHEQLYGSQSRILGISDITPGTNFQVYDPDLGDVVDMSDTELVEEYKKLHAQNIESSRKLLIEELGLDKIVGKEGDVDFTPITNLPEGSDERDTVYQHLAILLQKELSKDAKYGLDDRRACTLQYDSDGHVIDFNVPLMDPIQSNRIQMLINSIIKRAINKQKIEGGPLVQATAYDKDLHIRFKDKKGNILPSLSESKMSVSEYKKMLKEKQAGIAYFECYMPIPDARLERLITKEDGSMMSFEELKEKLPADIWKSITEVIGYRIPTEDKYSMLPLKIVGFVPKAAGQVIMMPQEITYLTGSDFDIDKLYVMKKAFEADLNTKLDKNQVKTVVDNFMKDTNTLKFKDINTIAKQVMQNALRIMDGDYYYSWTTGIPKKGEDNFENAQKFVSWYKDYLMKNMFTEYSIHSTTSNELYKKKARDNRILDLQWAVLTNEDTASKMLNPGNFDPQKRTGRMVKILKDETVNPKTGEFWTWEELSSLDVDALDALIENTNPHNTTLPSSKIYFQRQNMQGTQMTGIFANNNVSHAFMTFQHVGIDLYKGEFDNTFMFDGVLIGDPNNPTRLDPMKGFNGQLISKTIASFLAAAVDTAKDPTLADMNVNTFTGGVAMTLARLGFDTETIGLFLSQPIVVELSELFFKNRTDGVYDGETAIKELAAKIGMSVEELSDNITIRDTTLSKENFIDHLNDSDYDTEDDNFQKRVLRGFYSLFKIAQDLQELTFCTKFNSVTNAVGPTIADTIADKDRVETFIATIDNSVFYVPLSDNEEFTNPAEVIQNDPILAAFYNSTVGEGGASEQIFSNFFPHYYKGFQNMLKNFKENFLGNKKISSKMYNQLLNEYIYYILTYDGQNIDEYTPTLPYTDTHKQLLVSNLVNDFQKILAIKGRRPNMILDQSLGGNCLRIREADEFLSVPTLVFNGGQLDNAGREKIKNAWSDLITMQDPNLTDDENEQIRRFGVDLFFYNLMRNGFTFSPKTMMVLASTIVRYNATYSTGFSNYITGIRKLNELDNYLMGNPLDSSVQMERFGAQFVRNHANNRQLVPAIDFQSDIVWGGNADTVEFSVPTEEVHRLYKIMVSKDKPRRFVTIIKKVNNKITQELYELEEVEGKSVFKTDEQVKVRYRKTNRLGLTNNFIEYDANSDLTTSFFDNIRSDSEDIEEEENNQTSRQSNQEHLAGDDVYGSREQKAAWSDIVISITQLEGPQKDAQYRRKLRDAYKASEPTSDLAQAFNKLLNEAVAADDKQKIMDEINKQFEDQDKCSK